MNEQPELFEVTVVQLDPAHTRWEHLAPRFDGHTYEPDKDQDRLTGQLQRVYTVMSDGQWHTLAELTELAGPGTEAGISARLRDLRKPRFGSHLIERERVSGGLFKYRLMNPVDEGRE